MDYKVIETPLTLDVVKSLRMGDKVLINGVIYTARDLAHKRLYEILKEGKELPFDLEGQIIYYVGPSPAKPGYIIGSAGPTTSERMDPYTPILLQHGLKGMIGKGKRSSEVKEAIKKYKAIYFTAVGGAGALISKRITHQEVIAFEELGPEAIRKLVVKDFPVVVTIDSEGNDLMEEGVRLYREL